MTSAVCFKQRGAPVRATNPAQVQKTGEFLYIKSSFSRASMKFNRPPLRQITKNTNLSKNYSSL